MYAKLSASFVVVALILLVARCSTKNVGTTPVSERTSSQFGLTVLDESFIDGSSAQGFEVTTEDYGDQVLVNIAVEGAAGLKALVFDLEYDPETYRPLTVEGGGLDETDEYIDMMYLKDRGTVHYGQALIHPQWRAGLTGDGQVAQVLFSKEATPQLRDVSVVSTTNATAAVASYDNGTDFINWLYGNQGDYDQNGEVNLGDLVPIAFFFHATGPFAATSAEIMADGDGNGEVNLADLVPISLNFKSDANGGYNVYQTTDATDYPDANGADNGSANLLGTVAFNTATGGYSASRKSFTYDATAAPASSFFWVRYTDGLGNESTASNMISNDPTLQPVLALTNPPAGGNGQEATPWQVDDVTDYVFSLTDTADGDVSTDAQTTYTISDPAAGSISAGSSTLNINDGYTGKFSVKGYYKGIENRSDSTQWLEIAGTTAGIDIYPDAADTDWAGSPGGIGTSGDPYVLSQSGGFNADFLTEFTLAADDDPGTPGTSGTPIDVATLTFFSVPPFITDFSTPAADGTFLVNQFTNGYVQAQDASMNDSNKIYVVSKALPE